MAQLLLKRCRLTVRAVQETLAEVLWSQRRSLAELAEIVTAVVKISLCSCA